MYLIMVVKYMWDKSTAHTFMGRLPCCDKACVKYYTVCNITSWSTQQFLRDKFACSWRRNFSSLCFWNRMV